MSSVIRSLVVKVGADLTSFQKGIKQAQKDLQKMGKNFKNVGDVLTKNVTVPIVAVGTALAGITFKAASAADDLSDLSSITGISTTQLQEMSFAGKILGTDLDTMTSAQTKLTRSVYDATQGNKDVIQSFQELGIQIYDSNGKLKDANTIFWETLDALGQIKDPIERDGIAMALMGKSAQDLNPLIKAGSDEIKNMMVQAEQLGIVLGEKQVKQLADLNDSWDTIKSQFAAAGLAIASELAPYIKDLLKSLSEFLPKIVDYIKGLIDHFLNLNPTMQKFVLILIGLAAAIGPLLVIIGGFAAAIATIGIVPIAIGIAVAAVAAAIAAIILNWDKVKAFFEKWGTTILKIVGGPIGQVVAFIIDNWDKISAATINIFNGVKNTVVGVFNGIITGIKTAINSIIGFINKMISNIVIGLNFGTNLANIIPGINIPKIVAPQIPLLAEGGILTAPTLAMVGEAGPEAVIPLDKMGDFNRPTIVQVILDGKVIQQYMDNGLGNSLAAFGGV